MAARSSSSSHNAPISISIEEKLVALDLSNDGPSELMRVGDGRRSGEAERSSLARQIPNSQKEKDKKGKAIIKEASDHERKTIEENRSYFRRHELRNSEREEINAIIKEAIDHQRRRNEVERSSYRRELSNSNKEKGCRENLEVETEVVKATNIECACCYLDYQSENMVQCRDGHQFCFKCISR